MVSWESQELADEEKNRIIPLIGIFEISHGTRAQIPRVNLHNSAREITLMWGYLCDLFAEPRRCNFLFWYQTTQNLVRSSLHRPFEIGSSNDMTNLCTAVSWATSGRVETIFIMRHSVPAYGRLHHRDPWKQVVSGKSGTFFTDFPSI